MAGLKSLAKDTALYGLSSIIGRLLNWLLVPLYVVKTNTNEYGQVTQIYAWVGFLLVLLTYGLETGFFRFANKQEDSDPMLVYSTCLTSLWTSTLAFAALIFIFMNPISEWLGYADNHIYISIMTIVLCLDVVCSLPFAFLRFQKRPLKFASLKLLYVGLNIALNLFFLVLCPKIYNEQTQGILSYVYSPETSPVFYILLSNLLSTSIQTLFLAKELFFIKYKFDFSLLKSILIYSLPLLILGIAGVINQTGAQILFEIVYDDPDTAMQQLGIYGANYKFAVIMIMFIQAFRFAYEPFVFGKYRDKDNKTAYIQAMKYFIIFGLFIFLGVGLLIPFLPNIPYVANHAQISGYMVGLAVVPIIMMAEFFFGIFFNLSFWYKLTDTTYWGAIFSLGGPFLTILLNVLLVPGIGYMACAWIAFSTYFLSMISSYFVGKKYYPIDYEIKNAAFYTFIALLFYFVGIYLPIENIFIKLGFRIILILLYVGIVLKKDLPLKDIPVINRFIKN